MDQEPDFLPLPQAIDNKGLPGGVTPSGIAPGGQPEHKEPLPPPSWLAPLPPEQVAVNEGGSTVSNVKDMQPVSNLDHKSPVWFFMITVLTVAATVAAAYLYLKYRQ